MGLPLAGLLSKTAFPLGLFASVLVASLTRDCSTRDASGALAIFVLGPVVLGLAAFTIQNMVFHAIARQHLRKARVAADAGPAVEELRSSAGIRRLFTAFGYLVIALRFLLGYAIGTPVVAWVILF